MKKFTKPLLLFKGFSGIKIQADFDWVEACSDAGLLSAEKGAVSKNRVPNFLKPRERGFLCQVENRYDIIPDCIVEEQEFSENQRT